ncbi:asparagine synthase-related protein [Rossellomorea aquimaris]|uniref:asparagine synthase-related protein n=1 Tax=Rossellomorea aquimaris TaxID=189382 RepID=UPI0037C6A589
MLKDYIGRFPKGKRRNPQFDHSGNGTKTHLFVEDMSIFLNEPIGNNDYCLKYEGNPYFLLIDGTIILDGSAITNNSSSPIKEERILRRILENPKKFFNAAEGNFVLVLWDIVHQRYLVSRDKMGMKNIFYAENEEGLYFSSSIRNLLEHTGVDRTLCKDSIHRYIFDHPVANKNTIHKFIYRVEFGSFLSGSINGTSIQERYYEIKASEHFKISSFREDFKELFIESVKNSTVESDEIGIALSGGLDSTSIASVVGKHLNKNIIGTSYIFKASDLEDEEYYIDLISQRYGIELIKIEGNNHWTFQGDIQETIQALDEPYPIFNYHFTAHAPSLVNDRTNIYLSGLYGDQVLYGNLNYLRGLMKKGSFSSLIKEMQRWKGIYSKKELIVDYFRRNAQQESVLPEWIHSKRINPPSYHSTEWANYEWDEEDNVRYYMTLLKQSSKDWTIPNVYTPNNVDIRLPFLNPKILEYLAAAPAYLKINPKYNKYILRESLKEELPREIRTRKGKSTHFSFIHNGFKKEMKQLKNVYDFEILSDMGVLDPKPVKEIIANYYMGHFDDFKYFSFIIRLLSLEIWLKPRRAYIS